jgi:hypothetical protein
MAERRQRKPTCFQKMRNGVIKKADTAATTDAKVSAQLSPEDLVHMVDVSVASKYGVDLTQFIRVIVEDLRSMLDTFKTDLNISLPRLVRSIVQQIGGETQGKCVDEVTATPSSAAASHPENASTMINFNQGGSASGLNFPRPYYQTMAYDPNMPPSGSRMPHGPVPDVLFPRTLGPNATPLGQNNHGEMTEGVRDQIALTLREFGFNPRGRARVYQKPYLNTLTPSHPREALGSQISLSLMVMILRPLMNI